jgi:DEAD/DEAH box helicase domain-containing protein
VEPGREAEFAEGALDSPAMPVLESRGIGRLYAHQAEAVELVRKGENVVVTAPTASGKTEIFLIPVVEEALKGRRSLVVYPTKALARDQLARFREFSILGVRSEVYDGDTPQSARERIRGDFPHVLITNFDMLHFMLLNTRIFRGFFRTVSFVVVDEIHTNSGTLGGHAANIVRRLKRVAEKSGNARGLRFICSSATVGNAREFAESLCGEGFSLVDASSSPRALVRHVIANPPLVGGDRRGSYTGLSLRLAQKLLGQAGKVLVFGNSHSVVERMGLMAQRMGIAGFRVYRSGLSQKARKEIEKGFRSGGIRALAATSALELGMDIGSVGAVVLAGYPGTVSRVRQRVGRCGRKGQDSVAVFIARDNPLDQYFVENPDKYLNGRPESCYANPENEFVLKWHVLAMMRDWPADEGEIAAFSPSGERLFAELREEQLCKPYGGGWIPTKEGLRILRRLSIRGTGARVRIIDADSGECIGERERPMAMKELFPGAVYLHGGRRFESESLDLERGEARVRKADSRESGYTTALSERTAEVVSESASRGCLGGEIHYGRVHIREEVYGFTRKNPFSDELLQKVSLPSPLAHEFDTLALWMDFPPEAANSCEKFGEGLHAVEHCAIAMLPALTGADQNELGGISYPSGRMFIYDGIPSGSGASGIAFSRFEETLSMARARIAKCRCRAGCPSCVMDPQCGNQNRHLDKGAGLAILDAMLGGQA